jgi:hypothetical protein
VIVRIICNSAWIVIQNAQNTSFHNIIRSIIGNIAHYVVIKYYIIRGHSSILPVTDVPGVYKVLEMVGHVVA